MVTIKAPKEFSVGLLFAAFGVGFVALAHEYPLGGLANMGPGYFPTLTGALLAAVGLILVGRSVVVAGGPIGRIGIRPLVLVLTAIVLFGLLIDTLGLIVAIAALVFVGAAGGRQFRLWEVTLLAAALVLASVVIFYYGLSMPLMLGPKL
jgi:hypothetical protein